MAKLIPIYHPEQGKAKIMPESLWVWQLQGWSDTKPSAVTLAAESEQNEPDEQED